MFGLASPPKPPSAPRWSTAGTLSAMIGIGGNTNGNSGRDRADSSSYAKGDAQQGMPAIPRDLVPAGPLEAEDDPLPLDILPGNKQPLAIDRRVDDLLRLLRPARRAEGYRRSVFRFVFRQVRTVWVCIFGFGVSWARRWVDNCPTISLFSSGRSLRDTLSGIRLPRSVLCEDGLNLEFSYGVWRDVGWNLWRWCGVMFGQPCAILLVLLLSLSDTTR